ncbi:hypothetical protein [Mesorhizobium sp. Z1-4]|uniref:hypothetical protein n=1 Tax=Mesorhizobium sp. Z1-4 TaxID=2448478 RepID=UPI0013E0A930|nr:hypothetical protein [Mesorhizobium sp. Z1-4]
MSVISIMARYACAMREFVAPSYRPERHYMRGPGPACAKRGTAAISHEPSFQ